MGYGFIQYAKTHQRRYRAWLYYARIMPAYYLSKFHLVQREYVFGKAIELLAWLIQGYSLEEATKAFDWVVQDHILPSGREDVLTCLKEHQRQGHLTLIVSSGLMPCLTRIAEHLGVTGVIGTDLEVIDDRYTGRIQPPVLIGEEKGIQARRYFSTRSIEIDWEASFAYADSSHDLAMFELVGNPIAVNPDPSLRRLAQKRKWKVID